MIYRKKRKEGRKQMLTSSSRCKMDKPYCPRLPSHLRIQIRLRLFFLDISAQRKARIAKAARFSLGNMFIFLKQPHFRVQGGATC